MNRRGDTVIRFKPGRWNISRLHSTHDSVTGRERIATTAFDRVTSDLLHLPVKQETKPRSRTRDHHYRVDGR